MSPGKSSQCGDGVGDGVRTGMRAGGFLQDARSLKCGNTVKQSVVISLSLLWSKCLRAESGAWELSPGHG